MNKMIKIRKFKKSDIPQVTHLWNQNVKHDLMTEPLLFEKTFADPDFKPGLTLIAGKDKPKGFMQGLHRITPMGEKIGWIKLFFIVKPYRRQGIASMLLQRIEEILWGEGVSEIRIMDSNPNYFQPGIDPFYTEAIAFVERNGYKKFADTANLIADLNQDLDTVSQEQALAGEGIGIRRALERDRPALDGFLANKFPMWKNEAPLAYQNKPISLHLAFYHGNLGAFSAYNVNNLSAGWFGPIGTDDVFRGKGVGGILLKRCLQDIKTQGHRHAIIPWVGPIPFYMHYVNAHVHRVFWRYKKERNK